MKAPVQKIQGWLQEVGVSRPAFPAEVADWKQKSLCNTGTNTTQHLSTRKEPASGEGIHTRATQPEAKLNRAGYRQSRVSASDQDDAVEGDNGEGRKEKQQKTTERSILKGIYIGQ